MNECEVYGHAYEDETPEGRRVCVRCGEVEPVWKGEDDDGGDGVPGVWEEAQMTRDPDRPADPPTDDDPDTDEWIPDEFREGGD